ncbi:hypothetical protein D3C78_1769770 [compost metagenome]
MHIAVANAAGHDLDENFANARLRYRHLLKVQRPAQFTKHSGGHGFLVCVQHNDILMK